jgi:hypothetical protein
MEDLQALTKLLRAMKVLVEGTYVDRCLHCQEPYSKPLKKLDAIETGARWYHISISTQALPGYPGAVLGGRWSPVTDRSPA